MGFPTQRPRRVRGNAMLRTLVRETSLEAGDLVYPMFVVPGRGVERPIASMPGISQLSIDRAVAEAREVLSLGIAGVILFGIPSRKDALGSEAYDPSGVIPRAVQAIRESVPGLLVITDVCLCEYTDHGHCGVVEGGEVDNDRTLELLAREAVCHARAGAHVVAPSDMMDGRVKAIRQALDAEGFATLPILAYAAKYASGFYGPFREAAESAPRFGDRRGYQMDPGNGEEALREVALDLEEGADIVMVKPAMPYLDVLRRVRERFPGVPLAAYNVSGEYAMLKAAAERGWIDGERVTLEILTSIRRAGADFILTYSAKDAARLLGAARA
ncbi:MAG: porphobilinogen synthase [Deltaproteobacteria bacterium]|nr:porphobilinogen synthase [Deltaproteobacteria bacterium]